MEEPTSPPRPPAPGALVLRAPTRLDRLRAPLLTAGLVGGLTLALHLRDPHTSGSWGFCPWLVLTGSYCPGCGGLRAVNDLSNGDLVGAASSNLVFVLAIPLLALFWVGWTRRAWRGDEAHADGRARPVARDRTVLWVAVFSLVMVVFTVLRNLPVGAWLAP